MSAVARCRGGTEETNKNKNTLVVRKPNLGFLDLKQRRRLLIVILKGLTKPINIGDKTVVM